MTTERNDNTNRSKPCMVRVSPKTHARINAVALRWQREYYLGKRCLPDALVDSAKPVTADMVISLLLDEYEDKQRRNARSNAKRSGRQRKPAPEPDGTTE